MKTKNLCGPQVECIVNSIRNCIKYNKIEDATTQFTKLCHYSLHNEEIIYELGIEIINIVPNNHEILAKFHEIIKDIFTKEPLEKTSLSELYLLVNSRVMQKSDNRIESIICGVFEYALYKIHGNHSEDYVSKSINHLRFILLKKFSSLIQINPPFIPYFDIYFELIFSKNDLCQLNTIIQQCICQYPSMMYFYEFLYQFLHVRCYMKYFPNYDKDQQNCVLNKISSIDPHHHYVNQYLIPILEIGKGFPSFQI
ncbi:hypothetical protein HZS_988 [Henneguya salminicola]|nr:hypothetical protein HZS_988 [Henneguya salminicola]